MKRFKRIGAWIIVSLFLQSAVLFYLDKFYFVTETNFNAKKVETPTAKPQTKQVEIKIPDTAKHVNTSYDGKFIAYYEGDSLQVVNTLTGTKNQVSFDKDEKVSFYKWLPDIDSMIIAEKRTSSKGDTLSFSNYDVQKNKKKDISIDSKGKTNFIVLPDKQSEVQDIVMSTLTNMIYIKIDHKGNKNSIYSMNVMSQIERLRLATTFTGDILTFTHEARLAYEDPVSYKVYSTGLNKPIAIKGVLKSALLATDNDNNLYVGQLDGEKINRIYYGAVKDSTDKWKSIDLKNAVDKKDIFVSLDGDIYINDNLKGIVTNIVSGKETKYTGRFLQMYDGGIATTSNGKLTKINLVK